MTELTVLSRWHKFASPEYPLRPSALPKLIQCMGSVALSWVEAPQVNTLGGAAAQTGNLVHEAVNAFHSNGNNKELGDAALEAARQKFPGGKAATAQKIFEAYAQDQENLVHVPYVERGVTATFAPYSDDPSQLPIVVTGTADQIRRNRDGKLEVWDIKTGTRLDIGATLNHHVYQISGYAVAATQTLGEVVSPGGIIYTEGYFQRPVRTRIYCPWHYEDALHHMEWIRRIVTEIRKGNVSVTPGDDYCQYCTFKSLESCIPKLKESYGKRYTS